MARGQSQRSSASVRSEFGEEKTTPKNVAKLTSKFDVNMIQPTADGSYGINYDAIIGAVENFGADARSAGLITDVLEHSYLKSVKAITELEAEKNGETSPALTRTLNDRYDPKIKELESSIADELKSVSSGTLRVIEGMLSKLASDIDSQKASNLFGGRIVGAYKQGEVRKLFNDIYDTLNS